MGFKSRADQISHTLPTTRHCCNLDCVGLGASRGDGHRSLVTPKRVLSVYKKDLIFDLDTVKRLGFPNLFVTITANEWEMPKPFWCAARTEVTHLAPRTVYVCIQY